MELWSVRRGECARACWAGLLLLVVVGCGGGPTVAPVEGVLLLDDQPLPGASITTQPIATDSENPGSGSFGKTDEQGRFELELVTPPMKGAIVGEHRVMISVDAVGGGKRGPQQTTEGVEVWTDDPSARTAQMKANQAWPTSFSDGSLRLQVPAEGDRAVQLKLSR